MVRGRPGRSLFAVRSARPLAAWVLAAAAVLLAPEPTLAHAPLVVPGGNEAPGSAFVLDDPARSLALGSTLVTPGEVDWYRMELAAGDPLVVAMTAPDAEGGIPADITVIGPGLPPLDDSTAWLAEIVGGQGAVRHRADPDGVLATHGGLGFIEHGGITTTAPQAGTYWIAVTASDPAATGKYVLAPGTEERFGLEDAVGMAALVGLFEASWPPEPGTTGAGSAAGPLVAGSAILVLGLVVGIVLLVGVRRSRGSSPTGRASANEDRGSA